MLTLEQQFSLQQMRASEPNLSKEQTLDLLRQAKRLYKLKSRAVQNVKDLSLITTTLQDQIEVAKELEDISNQPKHVLFDELISCMAATMVKDNMYIAALKDNKHSLFS